VIRSWPTFTIESLCLSPGYSELLVACSRFRKWQIFYSVTSIWDGSTRTLPVNNQLSSVTEDIMQTTSKMVKPGPCVTVTKPHHKKMLGYLVNMIVNDVLLGIVGLDWPAFLVFSPLYPLAIVILQTIRVLQRYKENMPKQWRWHNTWSVLLTAKQ